MILLVKKVLTHFLQKFDFSILFFKVQHLVSLVAPFSVDQCQSVWVRSYFLHQSQLLMNLHFEKKNRLKGPTLMHTLVRHVPCCLHTLCCPCIPYCAPRRLRTPRRPDTPGPILSILSQSSERFCFWNRIIWSTSVTSPPLALHSCLVKSPAIPSPSSRSMRNYIWNLAAK